jgi:SAM-dependent methyltransferase
LASIVEKIAIKVSTKNRLFKYSLFIKKFSPDAQTKILDIGVENAVHPWSNFLEEHYPYKHNITALSIEKVHQFNQKYPLVETVMYQGGIFPFKDKAFDIAWSNAVLEHVGDAAAQVLFLQEIHRCSKKAFITTPNRYFPVELHTRIPFLHWLPKAAFDSFLKKIGKGWASGKYMHLLRLSELESLLAQADIRDYIMEKNRLGPFTIEFLVIF